MLAFKMKKLNQKSAQNFPKKTSVFALIIILVLMTCTLIGCKEIKYEIITEKILEAEDYADYTSGDNGQEMEKPREIINRYKASVIIRSTDTSIWFIDGGGSFQFIRDDKIQIKEID